MNQSSSSVSTLSLWSKAKKWNWPAIIFLSVCHLTGLIAWPVYVAFNGAPQWQEISVFFLMYALAIFGINFGYHRALSHRSFEMSPVLKFLMLVGASSTAENSALAWCSDHRRHHRYQDTERDPYNINKGFWWAHMLWIFAARNPQDYRNCPDLVKDPLFRNQDKYYGIWLMLSCFGLPLALGFLLGRPVETLLLAGFTRLFLVNHFTYFVNSIAHYIGDRPYDKNLTARDSLFVALLTAGEGYHNYHHRFPFDFRNGHRWYQWDPVKWFVYLGSFVGLTSNLKRTAPTEIYRARIQAQLARLPVHNPQITHKVEMVEKALQRWRELNLEWQKMKENFDRSKQEQMEALQMKMLEARAEFKAAYAEWCALLRGGVSASA